MAFWQYFVGVLRVEITSADIAGAMQLIQRGEFPAWNFQVIGPLVMRFSISRRDWNRLCVLLERRGDQIKLLKRSGLYWTLLSLRKRPVLVVGIWLMLIFTIWLPSRVLFVQVQGNIAVDTRQILQAAAECGINFGASRRGIRSEKMKNALLEAIPELSWAGVNTYGCTAVISVREGAKENSVSPEHAVSSIVALRDGVIREITVLRGNGVCKVGQAVKAGQVLISGYTDCGIAMQATNAKGEVYAQTNRAITAVSPSVISVRGVKQEQIKKYSVIIGKKRINFSNNSGISGGSCAKIYEQRYLTLPGGFVLPVSIVVETWTRYDLTEALLEFDLALASREYLMKAMCAGKILNATEHIEQQDDLLILYGNYSCHEMIGTTRLEESILDHGKND